MIEYREALSRQLKVVEVVQAGGHARLIFCTHPAVVTLGRATVDGDVLSGCPFPQIEVERGGRATYHGPEQLVIYPILHLERISTLSKFSGRPRDVVHFLRVCEAITIRVLERITQKGIDSSHDADRETFPHFGRVAGSTGVWTGSAADQLNHKIASLGIAVRRWVSFHGIALNLYESSDAFRGLRPCGFDAAVMTSLEKVAGRKIDRAQVVALYVEEFQRAY